MRIVRGENPPPLEEEDVLLVSDSSSACSDEVSCGASIPRRHQNEEVGQELICWNTDFTPKHAKRYVEIAEITNGAISSFISEVQSGAFPTDEQSFTMDEDVIKDLKGSD